MIDLPPYAKQAIELLRESQPRIYLGARYGLTPHTRISPTQADSFLGAKAEKEFHEPFCDIASIMARRLGKPALQTAFADKYSELEVNGDLGSELDLFRPFAVGKIVTTGSYSNRIVARLDRVVTAFEKSGVSNIRPDANSRSVSLVMLHGWQSSPSSVLLTREDVEAFDSVREEIAKLVEGLLIAEYPWIILGCKPSEDRTFSRLCSEACGRLDQQQRPIFVVDPGETEMVAMNWPNDPFRHVRMSVEEFLFAATAQSESSPRPKPKPDSPPSPPGLADFVPNPDEPEPPAPPLDGQNRGGKDESPAPPDPGPDASRRLEIVTLDGRVFQANVPGSMRVAAVAGQFIRRFVHGETNSSRRERVVVDHESGEGWNRLDGNSTAEEAGLRDGDRIRVYTDAVAGGSVDPRSHEAYLNDVQQQLQALARQDDRVLVKPNLPQASDRYEITLTCGGWGTPQATALRPSRTQEQKILVNFPSEAPNVAPVVRWQSDIYHPNVNPKTGYVCLGALQESWTPLFGPQELVRLLIEVSEYRNFELDGVLNREAAIWAQLNPEIIVEHGGWAYQPTLEEKVDDGPEQQLSFEPLPTGVGLRRRRKS